MKIKIPIYLIIIAAIISGSCEKIIDINIPDKERKIVLYSLIDPGSVISAHISKSKSILEHNNLLFIEDAEVKVYEEGVLSGIMEYDGLDSYSLPGFIPAVGKTYRLEVEHSLLVPVHSETLIPSPVSMTEVDTSSEIGEFGNITYQMNVSIDDPPDDNNFYALSITSTSRIYDPRGGGFLDSLVTYPVYFNLLTEDEGGFGEDFINQNLSFYVDDKLFFSDEIYTVKGGALEMALEYYIYTLEFSDTVEIDVRLDNVSPEYFYYSVSKEKYARANDNPFAEPVKVYNNIENGFGLVASYTRTSYNYFMFAEGWK